MDRCFHQSIKKHLPHTQHDLYLVNRIVSLYPYIIIALIPLAVCLMLFLRLTSSSREIEGGISPRDSARFWETWRSERPDGSGRRLLIGRFNPKDLMVSLVGSIRGRSLFSRDPWKWSNVSRRRFITATGSVGLALIFKPDHLLWSVTSFSHI